MRGPEQTLMHSEAAEAADVAGRQLGGLDECIERLSRKLRTLDPAFVLTCARGSSDHAATFAKYLIETRVRTPVASFAPSTSSVYHTPWRKLQATLFLAISQSGRSPDLIAAAKAAREAGAFVVAIVNAADTPLGDVAEETIAMLAGPERSVAATKSFIASLLAVVRLVAAWAHDGGLEAAAAAAPGRLRQAWALDWTRVLPVLRNARDLYVVGRGPGLAIAQEIALKLKETCGIHAEAFSAAEVRHGPMAIVEHGFPVLMLVPQDEARDAFGPLAQDLLARGATVLMAGGAVPGALALPTIEDEHPPLAPVLAVQTFYRLAVQLSLERGLDPDRPPHLKKVTETR